MTEDLRVRTKELEYGIKMLIDDFNKEVGRCELDIKTKTEYFYISSKLTTTGSEVEIKVTI